MSAGKKSVICALIVVMMLLFTFSPAVTASDGSPDDMESFEEDENQYEKPTSVKEFIDGLMNAESALDIILKIGRAFERFLDRGFPDADALAEWLNEGTDPETVIIEDTVTVQSGESYVIGQGKAFIFRDEGTISFEEGSTLVIGPNFKVEASYNVMTLAEGSKVAVFGKEFTVKSETVVYVDGTVGSSVKISLKLPEGTDQTSGLSLEGHVDIEGQLEVGKLLLKGTMGKEIAYKVSADSETGLSNAELEFTTNLSTIQYEMTDGTISFLNTDADFKGTLDIPGKVVRDLKGTITSTFKASYYFTESTLTEITFPMTVDVSFSVPEDWGSVNGIPQVYLLSLRVTGDLSADNMNYQFSTVNLGTEFIIESFIRDQQRRVGFTVSLSADELVVRSNGMMDGTDASMNGVGVSFSFDVPASVLDDETAHVDPEDMGILLDLRIDRANGKLIMDDSETQSQTVVGMDIRNTTAYIGPVEPGNSDNVIKMSSSTFYITMEYGSGPVESRRISMYNLRVEPTYDEEIKSAKVTVSKLDYREVLVKGGTASITMRAATFHVAMNDRWDMTLDSGSYSASMCTLPSMSINVGNGASLSFDGAEYTGRLNVSEHAHVSGTVWIPFGPASEIVSKHINVSFEETVAAHMCVDFNDRRLFIFPDDGFDLKECPPGAGYVPYVLWTDGRGVPESTSGTFGAAVGPSMYTVTFGETSEEHEAFSTFSLPQRTSETEIFRGWFDGTATYKDTYTMPARDVVMKEIWAHIATEDEVVVKNHVCTVNTEAEAVYLSPNILRSMKYMAEDGSADTFQIGTYNALFSFDVNSITNLVEYLYVNMERADLTAFGDYMKPIGNGDLIIISVEDECGEVHELLGTLTLTVEYIGEFTDKSELHGYCMDGDGRLEMFPTVTNDYGPNGVYVQMSLSHLSNYVIKDDHVYDVMFSMPFCIVLSAVLVIGSGCVLFFVTRE